MRVDIKQSPQNSVAISAFTASPLGTPLQSTGQSSQASTVMVPHLHNGTATSVRLAGANDQQLAFRDLGLTLQAEIQAQFQQHFQVIQQREMSFMQAFSQQNQNIAELHDKHDSLHAQVAKHAERQEDAEGMLVQVQQEIHAVEKRMAGLEHAKLAGGPARYASPQ